MRDQMFEREINERLKTFLNQHIEFNEYRAFIHSTSVKSLEEMIVFITNKIFSKNNWNGIEDWVVVFYILTGRIALHNELVALRWAFQSNGVLGVKLEIEKFFENLNSNTRISFVTVEPDSIFIDISHTLNYPFNTGIQKVVRKIGESLISNPKIYWVIWNEVNQVWQLIDKEIVSRGLPFQNNAFVNSRNIGKRAKISIIFFRAFWHGVYSSYRYLITNYDDESRISTGRFLRIVRYFKNYRSNAANPKNRIEILSPFIFNQTLLIVEPIQGESITRRLFYLPKIARLSVLVYDLIPVSHPEYFTSSSIQNFPNYLKVLSKANNLITISEFTSSQVRNFVPNFATKNLTSIPLPIELEDGMVDTSQERIVPMFLCVGSLEPRKNHMSILKAAEWCWSEGFEFELTLVGGQGWKNLDVREYISYLRHKKFDIRVFYDASDSQVVNLYSQAFAFITVPWVEGFGLPLAEAISTGKFVIASKIDSHLEFGQVEGVYFVNPDEIDMIASAMQAILKYHNTSTDKVIRRKPELTWSDYSTRLIKEATK
jgi:glycosyltransferase involved in cell wall biosynthesis